MDKRDWSGLIVLLLLCFLFSGTPDVWDLLHAKAMAALAK